MIEIIVTIISSTRRLSRLYLKSCVRDCWIHPVSIDALQPEEHYMETSQRIMRDLGFFDGDNELKANRYISRGGNRVCRVPLLSTV